MGGWGHLGFIPADGNSLRPVEPAAYTHPFLGTEHLSREVLCPEPRGAGTPLAFRRSKVCTVPAAPGWAVRGRRRSRSVAAAQVARAALSLPGDPAAPSPTDPPPAPR